MFLLYLMSYGFEYMCFGAITTIERVKHTKRRHVKVQGAHMKNSGAVIRLRAEDIRKASAGRDTVEVPL